MRISQLPWSDPAGAALRESQRREIAARYGTPDSEPGIAPSATDIAVFLVAHDESDAAVGCGALRDLGGGTAEVKRMYVVPSWRGRGVAPQILDGLEEWARDNGLSCLRLETGDRQPDAVRFYTRSGYRPIPNFGAYTGSESSLCFERLL